MAIEFNREAYNTVFTDLEKFKVFCANAWNLGFKEGFVFDEKNLYNNKSYEWRAYQNYQKYGKPPKPKPRNAGRFQSNRRN
jgi:hypothetical protein